MKRIIAVFIVFALLGISLYVFVQRRQQSEAVISIYTESNILIIRDRSVVPRVPNYEVKKLDGHHYSIVYKGDRPKILYLSENPIYITPGDRVKLNILRISEPGRERDTLIATGDNIENYTYSHLILFASKERRDAIGMDYPNPANTKYSKANFSFYDDLDEYHARSNKYNDSLLSSRNYNSNIIRQEELDSYARRMFGSSFHEDNLLKTNKIQSKDFAWKVERDFMSKNISPEDTLYSPNIEGAISLYFGHLKNIKFSGIKTDQQLSELITYIKSYPNHFVREYLLYFLMQNYEPRLTGNHLAEIKPELDKIQNPVIVTSLKNGIKKQKGIFEELGLHPR